MTCIFRLVTVDGAPAEPPSLKAVAPGLASRLRGRVVGVAVLPPVTTADRGS
jgi:hypothetical protein